MSYVTEPAVLDSIPLAVAAQRLLFTEARTASRFAPEPVSDATLRAIWELARWPPTSVNSNPLRVLYVRDARARQRLIPHLNEGNRAKTESAPVVAIMAADLSFHEHMPRLVPFRTGMRESLAADDAHRESLARFSATLQIGYFLIAVRAAGLAAGPMGGFDQAGVDAEFFAESTWRSLLVVNIGKPAPGAWRDRLPRLDYDEAVRFA